MRAQPCPAGCLKVTLTLPCWETNSVSLFVGSLYWGYNSLGIWVSYSHCCLAIFITHLWTLPRASPGVVILDLIFFCVCVFLKICYNGPTGHRKCGGPESVPSKLSLGRKGSHDSCWARSCGLQVLLQSLGGVIQMTPVTALGSQGNSGGWREMIFMEHLLWDILSNHPISISPCIAQGGRCNSHPCFANVAQGAK